MGIGEEGNPFHIFFLTFNIFFLCVWVDGALALCLFMLYITSVCINIKVLSLSLSLSDLKGEGS